MTKLHNIQMHLEKSSCICDQLVFNIEPCIEVSRSVDIDVSER